MVTIAQILVALVGLIWLAYLILWFRVKQRDRERARRGYWVEYIGPNKGTSAAGKIAIVYHEGDNLKDFRGKTAGGGAVGQIYLPDENQWRVEMPVWLRERRAEVRERLQAEALTSVQFVDGPPPTA